ncbi:unnamed protein product [Thelazia callipaeda]|uniref:DAN domain-containing protein n=1 Tax=Thelazia callipaeda TaxID=103827 RepID=A0A0N5CPP4_THECL|nr:unnamed protein product [Thelazia callipaeda]
MQKTEVASTSGSISTPEVSRQTVPHHIYNSNSFPLILKQRYLLITILLMSTAMSTYSAVIKSGCHKHGTQYVIDEPGCDLVAVNVNMCSGYCMSFSFVNPVESSITVHGRCCRMVDNEWVCYTFSNLLMKS